MHHKNPRYPVIALLLAILLSAACGATTPQPTSTPTPPAPTQTPPGDVLGTTTGKVLTTTESGTGVTTITGVGISLDRGGSVDALLEAGVMDVIGVGIRVRVEPINHPDFEWRVAEIIAGGAATPDLSNVPTETPRCDLSGAFADLGSNDVAGALDTLGQSLSEKTGCEIETILIPREALVDVFLIGEADFALVSFSEFFYAREYLPVIPLLVSSYADTSGYYRGAFIVRADVGPQSLDDAAGDVFGYTYPDSFYGYHMPRVALANAGHDPNDFFSDTISIGTSSGDMFRALLDGEVDVGIMWADEISDARIVVEDQIPDIRDAIEIIAYTPWIPGVVIMILDVMPDDQQLALRNALIEIIMGDAGQEALKDIYGLAALEDPDQRFWDALEMLDLAEQLDDDYGPWP